MQIQNNIASVNSSRNQKIIKGKLDKSLEKLSSGFRINRAGDDAAGLAISELMRSQIRGLDQAMRNVNDGVSMTNTGEGALTEIHSMLQRMKTLAVQSANGTYSSVARENIESERLQLLDEIDRISQTTDFDGIPLFKGCRFFALPPRVKHSIHSCQKTSVREAHRWSFYYPKSGKYAFLLSESGKGTSRNVPGNVNFLQEEHS